MKKSMVAYIVLAFFVACSTQVARAATQVGAFLEPGLYRDVWQQGSYAYLASGWADLRTINVSNYSNMYQTDWWLDRDVNADESYSIYANNDYLYMAERTNGIRVFSLADKSKPELISSFNPYADDPYYRSSNLMMSGHTLFVGDFMGGLTSVDVSNPYQPVELDRIGFKKETGRQIEAQGIAIQGNYAYVANPPGGFSVVNISDPSNMFAEAYVPQNKESPLGVWDIGVKDNYAYVLTQGVGVDVYNIETPGQPTHVSTVALPNGIDLDGVRLRTDMPPLDIEFFGDVAFVSNGVDGVFAIDISDPSLLSQESILDIFDPMVLIEEQDPKPFSYSWGLSLDSENAILLVADGYNGIAAFDVSEFQVAATPLPSSVVMLASGVVPFLLLQFRRRS
ncbi:hypothetical protein [Pseudodesulfovibrio sp. zrk46]|uniref:LVIVD repeat-containing protein n=1 Tax=Pseudodesulfovibrio sp. zrk46 TaxID=2725288 RepID=UPI001448C95E|nr:hypothetical protein [Pseudodesulfovibrio sp. zrk46]QJB57396.1 hypothetical protein HFN16_13710 [Pseudodesulfovibrio sp. zrk46]